MQHEQRRVLVAAALKVVAVAVGIGLVVGLGAFVVIKALGLSDDTSSAHASTPAASDTPAALPTVALSPPGSTDTTPDASPTTSPTTSPKPPKKNKAIQLALSPMSVGPGQRINITGTWPGHDNVALQVQRMENGAWTNFSDVQAQVQVGTYGTYVLTSRTGDNTFRMRDPASGKVSNAVTVVVG